MNYKSTDISKKTDCKLQKQVNDEFLVKLEELKNGISSNEFSQVISNYAVSITNREDLVGFIDPVFEELDGSKSVRSIKNCLCILSFISSNTEVSYNINTLFENYLSAPSYEIRVFLLTIGINIMKNTNCEYEVSNGLISALVELLKTDSVVISDERGCRSICYDEEFYDLMFLFSSIVMEVSFSPEVFSCVLDSVSRQNVYATRYLHDVLAIKDYQETALEKGFPDMMVRLLSLKTDRIDASAFDCLACLKEHRIDALQSFGFANILNHILMSGSKPVVLSVIVYIRKTMDTYKDFYSENVMDLILEIFREGSFKLKTQAFLALLAFYKGDIHNAIDENEFMDAYSSLDSTTRGKVSRRLFLSGDSIFLGQEWDSPSQQ